MSEASYLDNPKVYNIEKAIQEQEEDSWTVPRGDVRTGDRAIIWKAKGNDQHRGIVALAEVLTDPRRAVEQHAMEHTNAFYVLYGCWVIFG